MQTRVNAALKGAYWKVNPQSNYEKKKAFCGRLDKMNDRWGGGFTTIRSYPLILCCVCPCSIKRAANSEVCVCVQSIKAIQQVSTEKEKSSTPSDPELSPREHSNSKWMNSIQPLLSSQLTSRRAFNAIGAPTQQWYWPRLSAQVWNYVASTSVSRCRASKRPMTHFPGPLCRRRAPTMTNWTNWVSAEFSYSPPWEGENPS